MRKFLNGILLLLLICLPAIGADEFVSSSGKSSNTSATSSPAKSPKKANTSKAIVITPEREAAAMTFVKQHHPELSELLIHLKESSSKEYERAIRDLFRASERLAQVQERDSQAYELELSLWKARSRAQLLGARLQMTDDDDFRRRLKAALNEEYDVRLKILRRERDKFQERVDNLDNQIERLEKRRNESIESQYQEFTKAARQSDLPPKGAGKKKNSSTPKSTPTAK